MEAAPRAEEAFPPRSRVLAITGAASGVQTEAASTFRPRTSGLLPLDLRIAERRALFVMPVDPLLLRGDVNEGEGVLARQQRLRRASSARNSRCTFCNCSTFPQVNDHR